MNADQIKEIATIILGFNSRLWDREQLAMLMQNPVRLDTMLSLLIGNKRGVLDCDGSPLSIEPELTSSATDEQHRQLGSLILTGCSWKYISERDADTFIERGRLQIDTLQSDFANFICCSNKILTWLTLKKIIHDGIENGVYTRFIYNHQRNILLLRLWLRGQKIDLNSPFSERFSKFSAFNMTDMGGSRFAHILTNLGEGKKFSDRILRSVGAETLQQLKDIPSHLWVKRRVFGLADMVIHSVTDVGRVPYVDCTLCDGVNGKVPGEIKWIEIDRAISKEDVFLEFRDS